ncbi:isoprenylcysteine carboxylmethyltransferase family protein [Nitrosomonas sp. Nm166]|uniref:methyltransferase family protein n=1 Tax=Nitrosomonas sp. Nm166 TaxID=1881054 RepID=UPI0008EF44CA|nr:methyltransferase [Nitrosomonas sp. Nm166]SFE12448.1 Protein-S-isoprenylcysteine O-methyltransferase Ste14 [Nitrosomonas sp. Nm166]
MNTPINQPIHKPNILFRGFAIAYALFAYGVGSAALFWLFLASIGMAPYSLSDVKTDNLLAALFINSFLVFLFGLQHTMMARKSFKQKWIRIIPAHLERSTFVLAAGIVMGLMLWYWQTLPGIVWSIEHQYVRLVVFSLAFFGMAYVLFATLVANYFELLGLRQAWLYATGRPYTPVDFKRRWVYRYSRHPMMLGLLIIFWSTPDMSITRFVLAVLLTIYLLVGIRFEEHSLIQEFGEKYQDFKSEVGIFFTFR